MQTSWQRERNCSRLSTLVGIVNPSLSAGVLLLGWGLYPLNKMDMTTNWSFPSNLSLRPQSFYCTDFSLSSVFFYAFTITRYVVVVPFAILVLYLGHQRWRQQRSFNTMSQSDLITYHIAVMQLFEFPGIIIYTCGLYNPHFFLVGVCILTSVIVGELLFHVLMCVERYLAVVHPITYLALNKSKGVNIRRFCVGGVWLFSFVWIILIALYTEIVSVIPCFCLITLCFIIVSFCSLSVLCALIRPAPGEVAGEKERVDQAKQKAFNTIMVITGALWLLLTGYVISVALSSTELLSRSEKCWMTASGAWFSLPSSLAVPLLFLQRAGKLRCFCINTD